MKVTRTPLPKEDRQPGRDLEHGDATIPIRSGGLTRNRMRFLAVAAVMSVIVSAGAGCTRGERGPSRFDETPARYWTALEAYEQIKPAMLKWHEDAYVVYLFAPLTDERPGWGLQSDGRVPRWTFVIDSPSYLTETGITLVHENELTIGLDGHPEESITAPGLPLPIEQMKDSNQAIETARGAGIAMSPYVIESSHYDRDLQAEIPLAWLLVYAPPEGGEVLVFIDAMTGQLIRNGFVE